MFAALAALISVLSPQLSGPDSSWIPFVIPWDGLAKGSAPDVSFLNTMPAGKNGFIKVKNGKFVESSTGKPQRFLGMNITARQAFPTHSEAEKVARRLAQLGVNVVRFHHIQQSWDQDGMIWKKGRANLDIDPVQVDKMDYFIAQLKKNGIYINMNLQTTRSYQPEQGFPESVKNIPFGFCKRIDKINRKMIALQKDYAAQLLDRVNPYTKLAYKNEPALMIIEINNENSLVGDPWDGGLGKNLESLPEPFRGEVVEAWNKWLLKKYGTDEKLKQSWSEGATELGPLMTTKKTQWSWENQSGGDVKFTVEDPIGPGAPTIKAIVNSNPGPEWHVQAHVTGLDFKDGAFYTVKFKVQSDRYRSMGTNAMIDQADWHNVGMQSTIGITDQETEHVLSFKAKNTVPGHGRISFVLGATPGTIWIRDLQVFQGVSGGRLKPNESLAKLNIAMPSGGSDPMMNDWVDFLADTERAYVDEMHGYLVKNLGLKANIIDTQIAWGGLTGSYREANSDYADNHAYWEHPSFPGASWDSNNWYIPNTPMVDDMPKQGGTLVYMAATRIWGKPYTISEYNHPAPNDYQAEMMPVAMSFAAVQDWDAVFGFDYGTTLEGQPNDRIEGYFALGTNPAKMAFYPSSAVFYRLGLVPTAKGAAVHKLGAKPWHEATMATELWRKKGALPDWMSARIGISETVGLATKANAVSGVSLKANGSHTDYIIDAPAAKAIVGFVGGRTIKLNGLTAAFPAFSNGFASFTVVSHDGKPLASSSRALLTVASRVENIGMGWDEKRRTVGTKWGKGPVQAQAVLGTITLKTDGLRKVFALKADGSRLASVPAKYAKGVLTFTFNDKAKSMWFEVAK